ncbi:tryptophan-rich antigen, putative [Hepatocystis sp. ex Piliocolobus tephrosceles]|nr:tryptophan-rich antigen, putative [Hepatocystis sp. ex Piliocolobus tephrosceles]
MLKIRNKLKSTVQEPVQEKSWSSEQTNEPNATKTEPVATSSADASNPVDQQKPLSARPSYQDAVVKQENTKELEPHDLAYFTTIDDADIIVTIEKKIAKENVKIDKFNKWINNEQKNYFKTIEIIKPILVAEKVKEVKKFLSSLEIRWFHFYGNINESVRKGFLQTATKWSNKAWISWMYTISNYLLTKQFETWFESSEEQFILQATKALKILVLEKTYTINT